MVTFPLFSIAVVSALSAVWAETLAAESYTAGAKADQVTDLPGAQSSLISNQFSGYLDVSDTKALHYMYFESERNPATDSVIFWTNGGPGSFPNAFLTKHHRSSPHILFIPPHIHPIL